MLMQRLMTVLAFVTGPILLGTTTPVWANGDYNGDGIIDLADYAEFPACLAGPGGGLGTGCEVFDFDSDTDVDAFDFAGFQVVFGTSVALVIDTVPVGNLGNAVDDTGYGGVAYAYNIGKYEVTAGQYCVFLNAVAATDTYGLYNERMDIDSGEPYCEYGCNIKRSGSSPNYAYSVTVDRADRPVNCISWGDAARFANWLHNGQPTGVQDLATTEGGSYFLDGATSRDELMAILREPDATWVIPSEDEWYKVAYHKNDGVTGNYWDYPTGSDSVPSNDLVEPIDPGNNATFKLDDFYYTIGSPYWRTEVGAHENSNSPYGTFDQGGNVWEWNEARLPGQCRGTRSGAYCHDDYSMHATYHRGCTGPTAGVSFVGLRVAEVP